MPLTTAEVQAIAEELFAEDIPLPPNVHEWSEDSIRAYLESGGEEVPSSAPPATAPTPPAVAPPAVAPPAVAPPVVAPPAISPPVAAPPPADPTTKPPVPEEPPIPIENDQPLGIETWQLVVAGVTAALVCIILLR